MLQSWTKYGAHKLTPKCGASFAGILEERLLKATRIFMDEDGSRSKQTRKGGGGLHLNVGMELPGAMSPPSRHVSAHPTHTHLLVFDLTEQRFLFASSAACLQRWWRRSCSFLTAGTQQKSPKNPGNRREFLTSLRIKRPEAGFLLHPTVIR